jgi:hypothetical protein
MSLTSTARTPAPPCPLFDQVNMLVGEVFRRGGAPAFGQRTFLDAGLPFPTIAAEIIIGGGPGSYVYAWLANTLISVAPRLAQLGFVSAAWCRCGSHVGRSNRGRGSSPRQSDPGASTIRRLDSQALEPLEIASAAARMSALGSLANNRAHISDVRLTPQEPTCPAPPSMSAKCQKRTLRLTQFLAPVAQPP